MTIGPTAATSTSGGRTVVRAYRLVRDADLFFRYAAIAAIAEFVTVFVAVPLGLILHVVVLLGCAFEYLRRPAEPSRRVLMALALIPVSRLLGLTMPLANLPPWSWYALAGAPLIAGASLMTMRLHLWERIGLAGRANPRVDVAAIATGLALGFVAGALGAGPRLDGAMGEGIATALALLVFVAFPEELIFRGLLQRLAGDAYGVAGIVMVGLLYATAFLTSLSPAVVLVMGVAGAAFALSVERGGSLWGTIAGHAILVVGAALVWPAVLA